MASQTFHRVDSALDDLHELAAYLRCVRSLMTGLDPSFNIDIAQLSSLIGPAIDSVVRIQAKLE